MACRGLLAPKRWKHSKPKGFGIVTHRAEVIAPAVNPTPNAPEPEFCFYEACRVLTSSGPRWLIFGYGWTWAPEGSTHVPGTLCEL